MEIERVKDNPVSNSAVRPSPVTVKCSGNRTSESDGNQTLVKTSTGTWRVAYNGENRPIRWESGDTIVTMSFDRMGRRVTKDDRCFVYDGYLQVADSAGSAYVWDPTESAATRPLAWVRGGDAAYYTHDGSKNVSEVVAYGGTLAAHYGYAPFGAVTVRTGSLASANPFRFSSEYADDELDLVYYNYRHYDPMTGRWLRRDPLEEMSGVNLYLYVLNAPQYVRDQVGLFTVPATCPKDIGNRKVYEHYFMTKGGVSYIVYKYRTDHQVSARIAVNGCSVPSWLKWLPAARLFNSVFNAACNNHDICYGTCNSGKEGCDKRFLAEMRSACHSYSKDVGDRTYCFIMAYAFYESVNRFGSPYYDRAQDSYCEHEECSKCWDVK